MLGLAGCERVGELFEDELDDSAEGMSGRWEIVSVSQAKDDCKKLEPADAKIDQVTVSVATEDSESGAVEYLRVEACAGQECGPIADRYSRFERAEWGWTLDEYRADWSRHPACLARHVEATFVPLPDGRARIELMHLLGESFVEGEEDCDHEFARERRDAMSCQYRQLLELRRPPETSG